MATFVDHWARPVAQNVVATVITSAAGLLGWWAVSMTPALQEYAPFSYLVGALVVGLVSLFTLGAFYWMRRQRQATNPKDAPPAATAYDDAELRSILGGNSEALAVLSRDLTARLATLEEKFAAAMKQQTSLPLLQARLQIAERNEGAAKVWLDYATSACGKLTGFIREAQAGEYDGHSPNSIKMVLFAARDAMTAASMAYREDWLAGEQFVWEDCSPQFRTQPADSTHSRRFYVNENVRFIACLGNLLQRALSFEGELKQLVARRKNETNGMRSQIEMELRRIKDER